MSDKTSYSFNNIIINTINKFDCPSTAKLLHTTPYSPRRSRCQTKQIPQRKTTYTIGLGLRGGSLAKTNITWRVDV
jgi:hypothetical protein